MSLIVRIAFGLIGLVLIVYVLILGVTGLFDWFNPGGGSGRLARISIGTIIGLAVTLTIIVYRRFWK